MKKIAKKTIKKQPMHWLFKLEGILMAFSVLVLPVVIVWKFFNFAEPHDAFESIQLLCQLIVTGLGGLSIGFLLAMKFLDWWFLE